MSQGKLKDHMIYYNAFHAKFDKMLNLGDTTF